jgi:hypothetical protein
MNDQEWDLRRRIDAAERARVILEDPLLSSAFDVLDARFLLAWRNSPADQPELRERLWHHVQALAEVRAEMETVLSDGLLAKAALGDLQTGPDNP